MFKFIEAAKKFAHAAHDSIGQVRKYSGIPYWHHTDEVASIVATITNDPAMIAAAHLHDVIEDVFPVNAFYSLDRIREQFGERVAGFVFDLTDQYVKENYPQWNREIRKRKERERLGACAPASQSIKLSDLIANTSDIVRNDPSFAKVYLREKMALLPHLTQGDPILWKRAVKIAEDGYRVLGLEMD